MKKLAPLFLIVIAMLLTGCFQTVGASLDTVNAVRYQTAKKETDVHIRGLCSSNFNVIREKFGKNDQDWDAILTICESGQNSINREVK